MKALIGFFKTAWKDPVWSKVFASAIIGLVLFVGSIIKSALGEMSLVDAAIELLNYGVKLYVVSLGFIVLLVLLFIWERRKNTEFFSRLNNGAFSGVLKQTSYFRPAQASEIKNVYEEIKALFEPEEIMPFSEFAAIHNKNPKSIWVVCLQEISPGGEAIENRIGFFEFFPISETAHKLMNRGGKTGTSLKVNDVTTPSKPNSCFYIGGIGLFNNRDMSLRAIVLNAFYSFLHIVNMQKPLTLYTRPVTRDGMRLVKRNRFVKVLSSEDEMGSIWKLKLRQASLYHEEPNY